MRTFPTRPAVVALTVLLAACSSSPPTGLEVPPTGVVAIAPSVAAIEPGGSLRLAAAFENTDGTRWTPSDLTWRSTDPSIATVGAGGVVYGLKAGQVEIVAEWQGSTGSARVTVLDPGGKPGTCVAAMIVQASDHPEPNDCL